MELRVDKGVVSIDGDPGRSVTYGELLGDKPFGVKFTGTAPRKPPSEYKLVGTRVSRLDIPQKAAGKYQHMHHMRVAGMLHGRVVRPRGQRMYGSGAKVLSIDESLDRRYSGRAGRASRRFRRRHSRAEWDAVKAARQLKVTWQEPPPLPGNANLHATMRAAKATDKMIADVGDPAKVLAQAAHVASATYFCPYQAHAPFGPNARWPTSAATARW